MRRRWLLSLLIIVPAAYACGSFGEADRPAPEAEAGTDASPAADAGADASDADLGLDAGDASDGGPDSGDPCDQDHDGFRSRTCDGGTDCDDQDPRAHPDAGFNSDLATVVTGGDWNCDGVVDKRYKSGTTCSGADMASCTAQTGYSDDPPCGKTGAFKVCQLALPLGLSCTATTNVSPVQGCR